MRRSAASGRHQSGSYTGKWQSLAAGMPGRAATQEHVDGGAACEAVRQCEASL